MTELELLAEISGKLDLLIVIGIFNIFIHYGEKWLRIALELNNKSGRVN